MTTTQHTDSAAAIDGRVLATVMNLPHDQHWGSKNETWFALVRRNGAGYQVDCGWTVREMHDDDPGASSYHPFRDRLPHPWVGGRLECSDARSAALAYTRYKAGAAAQRMPEDASIIGSVIRG